MHLSIIEGFYGLSWTQADRLALMPIWQRLGYSHYVYAPKSFKKLRKAWREAFDADEMAFLQAQADAALACDLGWGLGLTPLQMDVANTKDWRDLENKLAQIAELKPRHFYLLFDDMRGDVHDLAAQQLRVLDRVSHHFASGVDIVFCPTYYSSDPILERLFGQRPSAYWADLGKGLDSHIGVFWTGEKVCSESYSQSNLDSLCELMRRKLTLWDNYPVNDSRRLCDFLRLGAFENRHAWLRDYLNLHVTNPMNQAWLSLLPLSTLPAVYAESDTDQRQQAQALAWEQTLQFFGDQAAELIQQHQHLFQDQGLQGMASATKLDLQQRLTGMGGAMALELSDWLQGRYAFDEACLTD